MIGEMFGVNLMSMKQVFVFIDSVLLSRILSVILIRINSPYFKPVP